MRRTISPTNSFAENSGVYFSDAAVGEVGLIVYIGGKRIIRLEIAEEFYSARFVEWLRRWARRRQPAVLRLVRN